MKRNHLTLIFILIALSFTLFSCTSAQLGSTIGGLGGAAIGGQIGDKSHRSRNAIIGAFAGAVIGYIVGNEMDKYDREKLNQTFEKVPSHKKVTWVNPDNHNKYEVIPEPAYTSNDGRVCRDAYIQAVINGEYKQVKTTACRNDDGTWEIVK